MVRATVGSRKPLQVSGSLASRCFRIDGNEGHQRRQAVAMVDGFVALVERLEVDRGVQVVRIGVELVEQVHEIRRRAGLAAPQVDLRVIARGETSRRSAPARKKADTSCGRATAPPPTSG